ncbi:MAG: hypothetical protein KDB63_15615 [Nocardioidaceae bacterium]|nr:hypothetical protein [Nocardioidaceae bacterium]
MAEDNAARGRRRRAGLQWLNGSQRYLAGATGACAIVASGFAVFRSTNGLGTVGLQAVGGIFLFLGITGLIPKRFTVGGNSVEYGEFAEDVVEDALKSGVPEVQAAVARQVLQTADRRGVTGGGYDPARDAQRLLRMAKRELHAKVTMEAIRECLPEGTIVFAHHRPSQSRELAFGRPTSPRSRQVSVSVMFAALRPEWLDNYIKLSPPGQYGAYVYLGNGSDLPIVASVRPPLLAIGWRSEADNPLLRRALAEALRVAESGDLPDHSAVELE